MRTDNLSASEDAILTSCEVFGGDAAGAAELCQKLDAQLTSANKELTKLRERIEELESEKP